MERHRIIKIEGWRYPVVLGIVFTICLFAVFGLIVFCWAAWDVWERIAGTGEHTVRMTGGVK
jgi:hypothetical protein